MWLTAAELTDGLRAMALAVAVALAETNWLSWLTEGHWMAVAVVAWSRVSGSRNEDMKYE